jgi:hypothetical protein
MLYELVTYLFRNILGVKLLADRVRPAKMQQNYA